jgi:hypothetical protein
VGALLTAADHRCGAGVAVPGVRGGGSSGILGGLVGRRGRRGGWPRWSPSALSGCTLRVAGVSVAGRAVTMSYAAGALRTSLPGGTVISTAYPFKRLRCLGCIGVVATWCLAVTGLLDPATLSVIGLTGVLLGGGTTGSVVQSAGAIVVVPLAIAGLVRLTRNPDRLGAAAGHVLRWIKPAPRSARRNRLSGADEGWSRTCNRSGRPGGRGWARGCCPC